VETGTYVDEMVRRIADRFSPLKVILFGSRAAGTAAPDSDVDLLVILPQVTNSRKAAVEMRQALADLPVGKDIVVSTPAEVARFGDCVGHVLRSALKEGVVLYERS
jgi:predicted nucleotidyltransferase